VGLFHPSYRSLQMSVRIIPHSSILPMRSCGQRITSSEQNRYWPLSPSLL
jgi:hypothetical protein